MKQPMPSLATIIRTRNLRALEALALRISHWELIQRAKDANLDLEELEELLQDAEKG